MFGIPLHWTENEMYKYFDPKIEKIKNIWVIKNFISENNFKALIEFKNTEDA